MKKTAKKPRMIALMELLKKTNISLEDLQVSMFETSKGGYKLTIDGAGNFNNSFILEKGNTCYVVARKRQKISTDPDKVYDIIRVAPELWANVSAGIRYFFSDITDAEREEIYKSNHWLKKTKIRNLG